MSITWLWRLGLSGTVAAWMGLIFYLSSLSQDKVSGPAGSTAVSWLGDWQSYAAHIVIYGILALPNSGKPMGLEIWLSTAVGVERCGSRCVVCDFR